MPKTKVLILHTSVGYGIKVTAENIFAELQKSAEFEPRIEDLQKVESGKFTSFLQSFYLGLMDHFAFVWGFLYNSRIVLWLSLPLRKFGARFKYKQVLTLLREYQPAIVVSTQTTATGIMAFLKAKGLYRGKLVAVFSDFHLHRFWLYQEVDLYICNIADQVLELLKLGVPKEKIALCGMFVAEKFFQDLTKEKAKSDLGLLQFMPVVLMTSGARTRAATKEIFLKLLRSPKSFQVLVVCGQNPELKLELETISGPGNHPVKIYGFVDNMELLMSAADVLVGKTGGPTMAEAVIKKLPMVITDAKPGHEVINLDFLLKHGIVDHGRIPREVVFLVEQILDGRIRRDWDKCFKTIVKPEGVIGIDEALNAIKPEVSATGLTVKNYQSTM